MRTSNSRDYCRCRTDRLPCSGATDTGRTERANRRSEAPRCRQGLKTSEPNEQMQRDADKGSEDLQLWRVRIRGRSRQAGHFCPSSGPTGKWKHHGFE